MGGGDKGIEIVYGEDFVLGRLAQPRQDKNLLYQHNKPNEPTKEGQEGQFVLSESPLISVSTISRGHPSLVSLGTG